MPNEQTNELDIPNEEIILEETVEEEPKEAPKKEYTVEQKLARINRMKTKLEKELGIEAKPEPKKTSELDNGDYAYLATKGIDEDDPRIDFIKDKMAKWGMPLRELMKDEDIQSKLKSLKIERDVRVATPSSTKRSAGTTSDNEDYFYQKYMQDGELPKVMPKGMAERLVERRYQESDPRQNPYT